MSVNPPARIRKNAPYHCFYLTIVLLAILLMMDLSFHPVTSSHDPWAGTTFSLVAIGIAAMVIHHFCTTRYLFLFGCSTSLIFVPRICWILHFNDFAWISVKLNLTLWLLAFTMTVFSLILGFYTSVVGAVCAATRRAFGGHSFIADHRKMNKY